MLLVKTGSAITSFTGYLLHCSIYTAMNVFWDSMWVIVDHSITDEKSATHQMAFNTGYRVHHFCITDTRVLRPITLHVSENRTVTEYGISFHYV